MKKTMKRILAFVLTFLMCASLAAPVFAADDVACPEIHTKKNCDAAGVGYTEIDKYEPVCAERGYTLYECNECHVYFADDIYQSAKSHEMAPANVEPTCDEEGFEGTACTNEGCTYTEGTVLPALGHDFKSAQDICEYKGQIIILTCTRANCGETTTKLVTDGHEWSEVPEIVKEPTCDIDLVDENDPTSYKGLGEAVYTCKTCGTEKHVAIWPTEHAELEDVEATAPDCSTMTDGNTAGKRCTVCGWTDSEVIPAEHSWDETTPSSKIEATCTTYGYLFYGCTVCGEIADTKVIAPYRHDWKDLNGDGVKQDNESLVVVDEDVAATCTTAGSYKWHCAECNAHFDESNTRPALGHDPEEVVVAPTCHAPGYTHKVCQRGCGYTELVPGTETPIDSKNHTEFNAEGEIVSTLKESVTKYATCTTPGTKMEWCTKCSYMDQNKTINATGHNYDANGDGTLTEADADDSHKKALCGVDGYLRYTCQNAGCAHYYDTVVETFDATNPAHHGHTDFANPPSNVVNVTGPDYANRDGSCTVVGIKTFKCTTCTDKANEGVAAGQETVIIYTFIEPNTGDHDWEETTPEDLPKFCGDTGALAVETCTRCSLTRGGETLGTSCDTCDMIETAPAVDATCTEGGKTAGEKCACVFDIVYTQASGANSEEEFEVGDVYKEDVECDVVVLPQDTVALGHNIVLADGRTMDCVNFGYAHYECTNECGYGYINAYVKESGHDWEKSDLLSTAPTCEADGEDVYVCGHAYHDATIEKVEAVEKTYHRDADGEIIKCIDEDFYCSVCSADEDDLLDADRSHYYVVTVVPATCQEWAYELHVCEFCQNDKIVSNGFDFGDHRFIDNWFVENEEDKATYTKPGVETRYCEYGCGEKETREYTLTGIQFSVEAVNGLVPGANIVNSGVVALNVYVSAYEVEAWGGRFIFAFDNTMLDFDKVVNHTEFTWIEANGVDIDDDDVADTIYVAYNYNNTPDSQKQNIVLNGEEVPFFTLYFNVKDDVTAPSVPSDLDPELHFAALYTEMVAYVVDGEAVVAEDIDVGTQPAIEPVKVRALADLNGDDHLTVNDALAIMSYFVGDVAGYKAEADIDKDGKITGTDVALFMQHMSGKLTYADLLAAK